MADRVEVAISPTTFTVTPGDTTEATVTLRNLGQSVDQFTISIDGILKLVYPSCFQCRSISQ